MECMHKFVCVRAWTCWSLHLCVIFFVRVFVFACVRGYVHVMLRASMAARSSLRMCAVVSTSRVN